MNHRSSNRRAYGNVLNIVDENCRAAIERMLADDGTVAGFECEVFRRDESSIWIAENIRVVRDVKGAVILYEGSIEDITERRRGADIQARRVAQVALRSDINAALAESEANLRRTLERCSEAIVKHLDAALARVWTLNKELNVLEMQASAGLYTHIDGPHGRVPVGKFKIGLIAEERQAHITNDFQNDPLLGDKEWAKREGMVAFAGYPLIIDDRLVGVVAMFARQKLPEDTLDGLASVANIMSHVLAEACRGSIAVKRGAATAIAEDGSSGRSCRRNSPRFQQSANGDQRLQRPHT